MTSAETIALNQTSADTAERTFRRRILGALVTGIVALALLVTVGGLLYGRNRTEIAWVDHTSTAIGKVSALATEIERLETARRGYLISPRDSYWRTYVDSRAQIAPRAEDLAEFTSDNPRQAKNLAALAALLDAKYAQLRATIELAHDGDPEKARANFLAMQEQNVTQQLRAILRAMGGEEERLLAERRRASNATSLQLLLTTVVVAVLLAGLSIGAMVLMRRYAEALNRSRLALRNMNEGLEEAVRDRTADLIRANEEIQRFAYIVSHDLRSPLVNVMGFTSELEASAKPLAALLAAAEQKAPGIVTADARLAVLDDIPEAIGFIRTSTRKMDRLITAILELSRQGRRTLAPERLDMTVLAQGVVDNLEQLARDKGAQVTVEGSLPSLSSDRLAIEQIMSNLVENAIKYLAPGRPGRVVVRGGASGGRAVFEVEDNGRGVDPRDHERIFELFRRSGPQDTAGEGIGLAHVRALVYRLGGTITCLSELGRGSTFRVSLPVKLMMGEGTTI